MSVDLLKFLSVRSLTNNLGNPHIVQVRASGELIKAWPQAGKLSNSRGKDYIGVRLGHHPNPNGIAHYIGKIMHIKFIHQSFTIGVHGTVTAK